MVHRTATSILLLGLVAVLLLPAVTNSYTVIQGSPDDDLVFEDEIEHSFSRSSSNTSKHLVQDDDASPPDAVAIIGDDDEGLPAAAAAATKKLNDDTQDKGRGKRQINYLYDDEDLEGSAQGSGDGSGLYRIKMRVEGVFVPEYANSNSPQFADFNIRIQEPIEAELQRLPGYANARVTKIQQTSHPTQLELIVDITHESETSEEARIRDIMYGFERRGQIGDIRVVRIDSFIEAQDPYKDRCLPGQVVCPTGTCATLCDGVPECENGRDEKDCRGGYPVYDYYDRVTLATPVEVDVVDPGPFLPYTPTTTPRPAGCDSDQFKCVDDGTCISNYLKCDQNNDCLDGSDEAPSLCGGCLVGQLECTADDKCLQSWVKCDDKKDCSDGSDENLQECCLFGFWCDGSCMDISVNCNGIDECYDKTDELNCPPILTCRADQFECNDGKCIENFQRCDKVQDCNGSEDEENCPCQAPNFECISGMCVPEYQKCDGIDDCDDGSDEFNCPCRDTEYECQDDGRCIPGTERCDGVPNCYDESDEKGCSFDTMCPAGQTRCDEGTCIAATHRCDGIPHCPDASDEEGCGIGCRSDQWQCADGSCITGSHRCDGTHHCSDGSDEDQCTTCSVEEFQCKSNGQCVPSSVRCDGQAYCHDGSDEHDCGDLPATCQHGEWQCTDGTCIPSYFKCDGAPHCPDRSDENNCPVATCQHGEWQCTDGTCIPSYFKCDGAPHCPDRSDENNCPVATCRSNEWQCRDGSCISDVQYCDGSPQCYDGSDEYDCTVACNMETEWQCDYGTCIDRRYRCDGNRDCPSDNSDERDCTAHCGSDEFKCDDGRCLELSLRCNGIQECSHGEDERNCPGTSLCGAGQFQCGNRDCIPEDQRCNGYDDCYDGTDEYGCPGKPPCSFGSFTCNNGDCVDQYMRCDGAYQCLDQSDEIGCPPVNRTCTEDEFQCENGDCIVAKYRCDDVEDCYDGSDETNCRCVGDEFTCDNEQCVEGRQRCNGRRDCSDGSDEVGCDLDSDCTEFEFQCNDGECVSRGVVCDLRPDCLDRSDELFCEPSLSLHCSHDSDYQCSDGSCIPNFLRCDGTVDCSDNSDEIDCPSYDSCSEAEFTCHDGQCVSARVRCDGRPDCFDYSDERNCNFTEIEAPTPTSPACSPDYQFECRSGQCININGFCNQRLDCYDGSDEEDCPPPFPPHTTPATTARPFYPPYVPSPTPERPFYPPYTTPSTTASPFYPPYVPSPTPERPYYPPHTTPATTAAPYYPPYTTPYYPPYPTQSTTIRPYIYPTTSARPSVTMPEDDDHLLGDRFTCDSGQTIQADQRCDGYNDCHDASDEIRGCDSSGHGEGRIALRTYPDEQIIKQSREVVFMCRDEGTLRSAVKWSRPDNKHMPQGYTDQRGRLVLPNIQLSDAGVYYCQAIGVSPNIPGWRKTVNLEVLPFTMDLATVPPIVCRVNEATCSNGECIPKDSVCDGDADCSDASDEMRCNPLGCEPNEFKCDNNRCVLKTWICDSDDDCGDLSDERSCGAPLPGATCNIKEFTCQTLDQCIPKSFHCDGEVDCSDSSDEVGCGKPTFIEPLPRTLLVRVTETFVISCRAIGIPTPTVVWRYNWGHVPDSCTMTSDNGHGVLTCYDARPTYQGAYSCEAINIKGSVFAVPDTIVTVIGGSEEPVCSPPTFNAGASDPSQCLQCFCFGASTDCFSTDRSVSQLPPPSAESFQLVGVNLDQLVGKFVIRDSKYPLHSQRYVSTDYLGSARLRISDRTRLGAPGDLIIFYSLPTSHKGMLLLSYGGYLRYNIKFSGAIGAGQPTIGPDVVIRGNGITIMHIHDGILEHDVDNQVDVRFWPGQWFKIVSLYSGRLLSEESASREDIMMALENVDLLLIKGLYMDSLVVDSTLSNVQLDTAIIGSSNQGRAIYVEQCRCPQGYVGISCQNCAPNFRRVDDGYGTGRCVPDIECRPGEYGDPANNIPCLACPCPLTSYPNQFGRSCYLDTDGQVTCKCPSGYTGRRCDSCSTGYEGNPNIPEDYCKPVGECDPAGSLGAQVDPHTGRCQCKDFTTGTKCDQCQEGSYYLSDQNQYGCIQCFCMGLTRTCVSSNLYRSQVSANFQSGNAQGFTLVDQLQDNVFTDFTFSASGELVYSNFPRLGGELSYWRLPAQFLGNKITAYGGNLVFALRSQPSPGGSSSRNNAYDVEIMGNGVTLRHYGRQQLTSNTIETVTVPLVETDWQRQDGAPANREHVLMALAKISYILIKATYTTTTSEVGLQSVRLDVAGQRNTGGPRAGAVEVCTCPRGYKGYSCEECAAGYTRGQIGGVYLGDCVPCNCNGHSEECDSETTECVNCRDNTAGHACEHCLPGYHVDPLTGRCTREPFHCSCDPRGAVSEHCVNGVCQCKDNVEGDNCNICANGFFDLSESNLNGCHSCWCSGVTSQCFSSNYYKMEIPMNLIGVNHGFVITSRDRTDVKSDGLRINIRDNQISFTEFDQLSDRHSYYWSLPQTFTGNLLTSVGGNLAITQRYESTSPTSSMRRQADVIIRGRNGQELVWMLHEPIVRGRDTPYIVPLVEESFTTNHYPTSRQAFLEVMSAVEVILILATPMTSLTSTSLSDVILDTAVQSQTGMGRATAVEQCRCPPQYSGLSCEECMPGYYLESRTSRCLPCNCNSRQESCEEGTDGLPKCNCISGYHGRFCEKSGPVQDDGMPSTFQATVDEPRVQEVPVGSTVTYFCRADTLNPRDRIIVWRRKDGVLPYGRASDDRNGRLVISIVEPEDSGQYVCAISDGFHPAQEVEVTLIVEEHRRPERPVVVIEEQQETVEVTVGQYFEVRCRAEGYPTPLISWSRLDNLPLLPEVTVQNGLLTFRHVTPESSGTYVCRGRNDGGQAQATITVVVHGTIDVPRPRPDTITVTVTQTDIEVTTGGTVRVDCSGPAQYIISSIIWSRINGHLPQSSTQDNGELVIPNAQPQDSGLYLCRVETNNNFVGEAVTRIHIIRTYNVPTVRIEPDRQTINQGSSVEVRCTAIGNPTPFITWSKVNSEFGSGVTIDGEVLKITNALVSDRGMYVCDAKNSGGSARAVTVIEVERREPPTVKMYPQVHQSILPGNTALFQCHLTGGIPMPEITWKRSDGRPLTRNTEVKAGGIITFNHVTGPEQGSYICTASNDAGQVHSTAVLEIVALPVISMEPSQTPHMVLEGARVRLVCSASGDPAPTVAWQMLRTNYPTDVPSRSLSPSSVEYEIASARPEDAGTYRCTASNSAGTTEEMIQVIVNPVLPATSYPPVPRPVWPVPSTVRPPYPPTSVGPVRPAGQDNEVLVPLGLNYEFICIPELSPYNDAIATFHRTSGRPLPAGAQVDNGTLYLYNVKVEDGGEYACVGKNPATGQVLYTIYVTMRIVEPLRITLDPLHQIVRPGDHVSLHCRVTGEQPIHITWSKQGSRMPPSVIISGGEMMFRGIQQSDAGKYVCQAVSNAGNAQAVAQVVVSEEPLLTALNHVMSSVHGETVTLRCEVSGLSPSRITWLKDGGQLPANAFPSNNILTLNNVGLHNGGRYTCQASTESGYHIFDTISLSVERERVQNVQVEAYPRNPRVGETVELRCHAGNNPRAVVAWTRYGERLPLEARQYDDRLLITHLRMDHGGIYVCTVTTPSGVMEQNYALVIQSPLSSRDVVNFPHNSRSVETRSAEFGSTVVMKCLADLEPPASFTWMKQDGQLPFQATVKQETLEIVLVHAEDAGTYLCTARNDQRTVDLPIMLVVTGVVPRFLGNSYMTLPTLGDAYLRFEIEISFRADSPDGLILYNSQRDAPNGDYVAFGLQDGYAVYQFDVGAGMMSLMSLEPLTVGDWHTVKLARNRKNGRMSIDGAPALTGSTEGRHVGLELLEPLYVGGVPEGAALNSQANYTSNFEGCVSRLVIKDSITELMRVAHDKVNVEACGTCSDEPCHNNGVCQESYSPNGYKCICSAGFSGDTCSETGDTCYPGLCGDGRCVNRPGGYDCFCPYGRTGIHCEHEIIITEPAFSEGSFIAYKTPSSIKRFSMGMKIKPNKDLSDGLLMYCAQTEQGDGDFTSLALHNKRLEFRFNTGTGTATITSDTLTPGTWIKIHANRTDRLGSLSINDGEMIHGQSPGSHKGLNLRIPLYVGGVDSNRVEVSADVEVTGSFSGCISEINVNERELKMSDMKSSLVDSANIGQCEDTEAGQNPEGACHMQDPCTNGGVCHDHPQRSYICVCPLGFTGEHCEHETIIQESASFSGTSWVEFGSELLSSNRQDRSVTLEFTTTESNGLMLWYGQPPDISGRGRDYLSLAISNGYLELKFRTRDGEGSVRSLVRLDDGGRHNVRAVMGSHLATLQVDNLPVETTALPSNAIVNARGGVFIGGVPEPELMTDGMYSSGFDGCLHGVTLGNTRVDTISESALSGVDVVSCSRFRRTTARHASTPRISFLTNFTSVFPPSSTAALSSQKPSSSPYITSSHVLILINFLGLLSTSISWSMLC